MPHEDEVPMAADPSTHDPPGGAEPAAGTPPLRDWPAVARTAAWLARMPPHRLRSLAAATVVLLGALAWLPADLDGDGLRSYQELGYSNPFRNDTDGDGLPDGFERRIGTDPRRADTDGDGLSDLEELLLGTDPLHPDTDGDGLLDGASLVLAAHDPRTETWLAQGILHEILDDGRVHFLGEQAYGTDPRRSDTDGDGIPDGLEVLLGSDPLDPDTDGDGVPDGFEGAVVCIFLPDCDGDGVPDGLELELGWDPLDPDTFGVGLSDGVVYAFMLAGQPASGDEDGDGIPDAWESATGLIDWGPFAPTPGTSDLLVEYVKVRGPDSRRHIVDLTPAYHAVSQMFLHGPGIHLQWVETTVFLPYEHRPGFLDADDEAYFLDVLSRARFSDNPFVTSVILNPQQQQLHLADILGAAFLRSMIAVVDYGAHAEVLFEQDDAHGLTYSGSGPLRISPVLESHIVDADLAKVQAFGFDAGGLHPDGTLFLTHAPGNPNNPLPGTAVTWSWTPNWFRVAPNVTTDDDRWLQFRSIGASVARGTLAATIAHELGHTLGLCHAHDDECAAAFTPQDRAARHTSTMSYFAPPDALHFLASEWTQVEEYLACPPEEPLRLLAEDADRTAILQAKYAVAFSTQVPARACGDFSPIERDLDPDLSPFHYEPPPEHLDIPAVKARGWVSVLYVILWAGAAAGAAWGAPWAVRQLPAKD